MRSKVAALRRTWPALIAGFALCACSAPAARSGSSSPSPHRTLSYSDGYGFAPIFASDDTLSETIYECAPTPASTQALPPSPTTNFDRNWEEGCKAGAVGRNPALDSSAYEDGYKAGSVLGVTPGLHCPLPPPGLTSSAQLAWLAGCHVLTYFRDTTAQPPEQAEVQAAQGYRYGMLHKHAITMRWCSFETSAVQAPDNVGQWVHGCSDYIKSDNTYPQRCRGSRRRPEGIRSRFRPHHGPSANVGQGWGIATDGLVRLTRTLIDEAQSSGPEPTLRPTLSTSTR